MAADRLRIATYNVSLYGKAAGQIRDRLGDGSDPQARQIAQVVQTVRPDILLVNEIDYDVDGQTAGRLAENFFAVPQANLQPIDYPFVYAAPSNTGLDSGLDLDRNGKRGEPADAWGYGVYPGQYAMAVYSRFPIDHDAIRTFQKFRWCELPAAKRPRAPGADAYFYDDDTWLALRLSSKNHVDVPIDVGGHTIHLLASHPTPPVFDGDEDRNGCRNHDEIQFWNLYLSEQATDFPGDDQGRVGGLEAAASVVVMGDLNADPADGDGIRSAIRSLLNHPRLTDPQPQSRGAVEQARDQRGAPATDTARFRNRTVRVDYVLPSRDLRVVDSGVFWPPRDHDDHRLIHASDHSLVWIEVELP